MRLRRPERQAHCRIHVGTGGGLRFQSFSIKGLADACQTAAGRAAPVSAPAGGSVRGRRLRRAHLRGRLVPIAGAVDRFVGSLARRAARHLHGWNVRGQSPVAASGVHPPAPDSRLRFAGTGDRLLGAGGAVRDALRRRGSMPPRWATDCPACCCGPRSADCCLLPPTLLMGASLPAAARWVEVTPAGRRLDGILLRRQHGRSCGWVPGGRLSTCCACTTRPPPPSSRDAEPGGGRGRLRAGGSHVLLPKPVRGQRRRRPLRPRIRGWCTSPSGSPGCAHSAPRSSGPACSR